MKKPRNMPGFHAQGKTALAGLVLLFLPSILAAQSPAPETLRKTVSIVRVAIAPEIDGSLDDPAWKDAALIDDLHQYRPTESAEPGEPTRFYLMYDDDFLYIGVRVFESAPDDITARQLLQGGNINNDDSVGLVLDPFDTRRTAYRFMLNPLGIRREGTYDNPTDVSWDWKGIWMAETRLDEHGWTAEMAIPFKTLSFDPARSGWGINFDRRRVRIQERYAWVSRNRNIDPGTTGLITGLYGLSQGYGLDVVPSLVLNDKQDYVNDEGSSGWEPSLNAFYRITPQLTAALTLNTDFSATDVDDQQVNLTRFSLFFPEKREFFLQDSEIFQFGNIEKNGIPFYSRRIGIDDEGQPVNLDAGVKVTGRLGPWSLGFLTVSQDGFETASGEVPKQDLFAGRLARTVLGESSVGLIATYGNASSELGNSLVGVDFRYRNTHLPNDNTLEGELWLQQSSTEGVSSDRTAFGAGIKLSNEDGFWGEAGVRVFEENFNPGIGFLNRANVREYRFKGGYTNWLGRQHVSKFRSYFEVDVFTDTEGKLETREVDFFPMSVLNAVGDRFDLLIASSEEVLTEDFEIVPGVVIPPGDYGFDWLGLEFVAAAHRRFAPAITVQAGDFYDGTRVAATVGAAWRPSPHLNLNLETEWSDVSLPHGDFTTILVRGHFDLAFTAAWAWLNVLQYDSVSREMGVNSRLRWIPRAGNEAFLVFNRGFERDPSGQLRSLHSELVLKISYTFRF